VTVEGASDDSGDAVLYTFTARNEAGDIFQVGPANDPAAELELFAGMWTIAVTADDDLACRDRASDATCSRRITVEPPPRMLISRWPLDGDLNDSEAAGNDGFFFGESEPPFVADRDGNPASALRFDGSDDFVQIHEQTLLPLYSNRAFSIALWVNGPPQMERRVWSEASSASHDPLFTIGPELRGASSQVEVFIRDAGGVVALPHVKSAGAAFDGAWHHIVWVDDDGDAALYIDGGRDAAAFSYEKPQIAFDMTTLGGAIEVIACCSFEGAIDDVRIYNYALSAAEVMELAGREPPAIIFHRGDPNDDAELNITDGLYVFNFLFLGGPRPTCSETADANDDGAVNLTDGIYLLNFLFLGGPAPQAPGPPALECGPDRAGSPDLGCVSYSSC
jgi:hypothetical protein